MDRVLPDKINFIFINKKHQVQPNLIVFFILIASSKNNYYIRLKSDENGNINLRKDLIIYKISQCMKNFPMDYNSSLEECIAIDVKIETKLELEKKAIAIENYYMEEYLLFKNEIDTCTNNNFSFWNRYMFPIRDIEYIIEV